MVTTLSDIKYVDWQPKLNEIGEVAQGIDDINQAMEPLYTSRPDLERSGMGFTVMETFMDHLEVESEKGIGTKVVIKKKFNVVS